MESKFKCVSPGCWELEPKGEMRTTARIYADKDMLEAVYADNGHLQVCNVACLPGIVGPAMAMPDIHWGYGFPIGGVAAFDVEKGIISPGGVGYDINCGVRLITVELDRVKVQSQLQELITELFRVVPTGVGSAGALKVDERDLKRVALQGARWAVEHGYGGEEDLHFIEEGGMIKETEFEEVSSRAVKRGLEQLGTLGSGNHFLELGYVDEIYDPEGASAFGLRKDQVTLMVHCGSRGFGYQVCDDFLEVMLRASAKYGIKLPDRQLACAPFASEEGQRYFHAMNCAINYAFANRQVISGIVYKALLKVLSVSPQELGWRVVYEVAHNIAKRENHHWKGKKQNLCVHRKGATRAFGPGSAEIPEPYRAVGQPVLVPGDMKRCSYVLRGTDIAMQMSFGSACHGAGRLMSRKKAELSARGRNIERELEKEGLIVRGKSKKTLAEELPEAYKDVSSVADVCDLAGIACKVVRIRPLGCIKG